MIERLIYTAITDGINQLTAKPKRLEKYFQQVHDLDPSETAEIRTRFLARKPVVQQGFPRLNTPTFPLICIVLSNEGQSTKFLDDSGGVIGLADVEQLEEVYAGSNILTSLYSYEFNVLVLSEHPDLTLYLYQLVKYFLTVNLPYFKENGLLDTRLSGADLAPDPHYVPAHIFVRRLTFACEAEEAIVGAAPTNGFIRRVRGIHVAGGTDTDGGVPALVVPTDPTEVDP